MKRNLQNIFFIGLTMLLILIPCSSFSSGSDSPVQDEAGAVLDKIEAKYNGKTFSADFFQESPLPDLGILEEAEGKAFFGKKEKFRWEYRTPETLYYISDGETLWIYSPADNNVWTGKTAGFFGKGSSAGFLTDIKAFRKRFVAQLKTSPDSKDAKLDMVPSGIETAFGISRLILTVDGSSGLISRITTFNMNNEETRITLNNQDFRTELPESLFTFKIPKNADVIPLESMQ